jgi:hypothetical protein
VSEQKTATKLPPWDADHELQLPGGFELEVGPALHPGSFAWRLGRSLVGRVAGDTGFGSLAEAQAAGIAFTLALMKREIAQLRQAVETLKLRPEGHR